MKRYVCVSLLITAISVSSCAGFYDALPLENRVNAQEDVKQPEEFAETISIEEAETGYYDLFMTKENVPMSLYEPVDGCYSGAYIRDDGMIADGDIKMFEAKAGENALYAEYMRLGGVYPYAFAYECLKYAKTPVIIIEPPEDGDPYDETLLRNTAAAVGAIDTPVFVMFYPVTKESRFDVDGYVRFFRKAYDTFKESAENAAVVWSIPHYDVQNKNSFYPGDNYTDWVGISAYADVSGEEDVHKSFYDSLDYFYFLYQEFKPIFLTTGISHYSTVDSRYYISEAAEGVDGLYKKIKRVYPRIKAVLYMDENRVSEAGDNYLLTEDDAIVKSYKNAVSGEYFTKAVDDTEGVSADQTIRSAFKALKLDDKYYISTNSVRFEFSGRLRRKAVGSTHDYNFSEYYDAADILPIMGLDLYEDAENMALYLRTCGQ